MEEEEGGCSKRESEIKRRKERAAVGGGAVECAEVCMSSEGFQLSRTIGGGKALRMTIGSLTPVKLAGGRIGEGGERGCPHLPQKREHVCICALQISAQIVKCWCTVCLCCFLETCLYHCKF